MCRAEIWLLVADACLVRISIHDIGITAVGVSVDGGACRLVEWKLRATEFNNVNADAPGFTAHTQQVAARTSTTHHTPRLLLTRLLLTMNLAVQQTNHTMLPILTLLLYHIAFAIRYSLYLWHSLLHASIRRSLLEVTVMWRSCLDFSLVCKGVVRV